MPINCQRSVFILVTEVTESNPTWKFHWKLRNNSFCTCTVNTWPKVLLNAYQSPTCAYLPGKLGHDCDIKWHVTSTLNMWHHMTRLWHHMTCDINTQCTKEKPSKKLEWDHSLSRQMKQVDCVHDLVLRNLHITSSQNNVFQCHLLCQLRAWMCPPVKWDFFSTQALTSYWVLRQNVRVSVWGKRLAYLEPLGGLSWATGGSEAAS